MLTDMGPVGEPQPDPTLAPCPFCGATMERYPDNALGHFFHPYEMVDGACLLNGRGFDDVEAGRWNGRFRPAQPKRGPITDCGCPYDDRLRQGHRDRCPTLVALTWPDGTPKVAPVQGYAPGIPWSLQLEAYSAYEKKWGSQAALIDLDRRGCRGGFGTKELDDLVPGWRDRVSEIAALRGRVAVLEDAVRTAGQRFREYEVSHRAKAAIPLPGDEGRREMASRASKADRNREMAELCEAAIKGVTNAPR
jgi:hypothetical protein